MKERNYCIYKHTSPSGKAYIGLTKNYIQRVQQHQELRSKCTFFKKAIQKYGWDKFKHEILLFGLTREEAMQHEATAIILHNTLAPAGYNLTTGGEAPQFSPATLVKIGLANLGRKRTPEQVENNRLAQTGKILTPEHTKILQQVNLGRKMSQDSKEKLSASKRGVKHTPERVENQRLAQTGKTLTPEHKEKIRQGNLGKKQKPESIEKMVRTKKAKRLSLA